MELLVNKEELCAMLKLSRSTLERLRTDEEMKFPKSFHVTGKEKSTAVWLITDIAEWLEMTKNRQLEQA